MNLPLSIQRQCLRLLDGRDLGYVEYGDPRGAPVFYFHGLHGSHLEPFAFADAPARRLGIRLIVVERPGYGLSTPASHSLTAFPNDLRALADALQLDRFAVMGYSGGGPYAVACAYALPERVTKAVLVASLGPLDGRYPTGLEAISCFYPTRILFWVARHASWLIRLPVRVVLALLSRRPWFMIRRMSPADQRTAAAHKLDVWFQEALFPPQLRHNIVGAITDLRNAVTPWDLDFADIQVPVDVFHGLDDKQCLPTMGKVYAEHIPTATWHPRPETGHLIVFEHGEEILRACLPEA